MAGTEVNGKAPEDGGDGLIRDDLLASQYAGACNLMFNELVKEMMRNGRKIFHLAFGQSPFPPVDSAVEALRKNAMDTAYLEVQGLPELRQGICRFHGRHDDYKCDPDQVIVGPGSKELIFLLMAVFRGNVLVLSPSWTTYRPQAQLSGHPPVIVTSEAHALWKLTPQALEETIVSQRLKGPFLLIMTNPCNPTGTAYTEQDLIELSAVFRKYNIIVLSDEIYARLKFDQNHVTLAKVYPERTIISSGLSKWASLGGWRVGYHVYPRGLLSLLHAVKSAASHTYSCAAAPMQRAAITIFEEDRVSDDYIRHSARILAAVADFCYRELTSVGVKIVKPSAGYYMFPDFEVIRHPLSQRGIKTGDEMCSVILDECSVALLGGGPGHLRPPEELTCRMCYVNFDGGQALDYSRRLGLTTPLPDHFVKDVCTPTYDGIMSLKTWVQGLLKNA